MIDCIAFAVLLMALSNVNGNRISNNTQRTYSNLSVLLLIFQSRHHHRVLGIENASGHGIGIIIVGMNINPKIFILGHYIS